MIIVYNNKVNLFDIFRDNLYVEKFLMFFKFKRFYSSEIYMCFIVNIIIIN